MLQTHATEEATPLLDVQKESLDPHLIIDGLVPMMIRQHVRNLRIQGSFPDVYS